LKWKLFIRITFVSIIPIVIFGFILYSYLQDQMNAKYNDYTQRLVQQITDNLDSNMQELDKIITPVYYSDELTDLLMGTGEFDYFSNYKLLTGVFYNSIYSRNYIYDLELFNLQGTRVIAVNGNLTTGKEAEKTWFRDTLKKKGERHIFLDRYMKEGKEYFMVSMSRAIYDLNTFTVIGVIRVNENQREIKQNLLKFNMDYSSDIAILTSDGELVYSSNAALVDSSSKESLSGLAAGHSDRLNERETALKGSQYLLSVRESPYSGFKVVLLTPQSEVRKESDQIKRYFSYFLIIYIMTILFVALLLSYHIANPILLIRRKMKSVEQENFDVRVDIRGSDEIAQLSIGFNRMVKQIDTLIHEKYTMKLLKREAELKVLQNQINPHFLNNSLSSIIGLLQSGEDARSLTTEAAIRMISSLSHIFRYNLDSSTQTVHLSEEIDNAKHYLALQKIRFDERLECRFDIEDGCLDCKIIKMSLQPLIENAIIHGIEPKRGTGEIVISTAVRQDTLLVEIADNGVGMTDERIAEMNAVLFSGAEEQRVIADREAGVFNVNARLQLMFGTEYGLSYRRNGDEGIIAELKLPRSLYRDKLSSPTTHPMT
jgi:two-component system sensor histidine kinase YesM